MRWINLIVIALFVAATIVFSVQNFQVLGFSARAPLALMVGVIYLLRMATGGSLLAVLRRSLEGSRRRRRCSSLSRLTVARGGRYWSLAGGGHGSRQKPKKAPSE